MSMTVVAGRTTIRAFGATERFALEQQRLTDENHVYNLASLVSARFLSYWVDLVCNLFVVAAVLFVVFGRDAADLTAGRAGVAIAYAISVRPTQCPVCAIHTLQIVLVNVFCYR